MTERFDFLEKRGYGYCIGIIDNQTDKHLGYVGIRDLMNQLHKENQILKKQNKRLHDDLHKINQIAGGY